MKKVLCILLLVALFSVCASCGTEPDLVIYTASVTTKPEATETPGANGFFVIINKNSKVFHTSPDCRSARSMAEENRMEITVSDASYLYEHGYDACGICSKAYKQQKLTETETSSAE